jgi:hypothetical protein
MTHRSSVADHTRVAATDHGHGHGHGHPHCDEGHGHDHSHNDHSRNGNSRNDHGHPHASEQQGRRRVGPLIVSATVVLATIALGIAVGRATSNNTKPNDTTSNNATTNDETAQRPSVVTSQPAPTAGAEVTTPLRPLTAGVAAATPTEAVQSFVRAEIDGRYADSLAILVDEERARLGPAELWEASHAQLPAYLDLTVDATDGARVSTTVTLEPNLDEVTGLTPARQRIVWTTQQEGAGWRVSTNGTEVQPIYPDQSGAATAALAWVQARQSCQRGEQYQGNLLGQPDVADALCGTTAGATVTTTNTLATYSNPTTVISAFGPEASEWARVVRVTGPASIDVVTAPLGDHWVVVGVSAV